MHFLVSSSLDLEERSPLTLGGSSAYHAPGVFGPYRVIHQIGSGVLGPVYRARLSGRDPADGDRLFALKAFHVDLTPEQTILFGDALEEIVGVGVSHPAVVGPVGAGVADGVPYLAYEYVAAESLDVTMRRRAPAAAEIALPFVVQLAEGLDVVHERGLAHGALHLRDVFVTSDRARASGFGIVAALDRVGRRGPLRRPYAAPEQIAGADWGPSADRHALAAVAYELLTGRRAGEAGSRMTGHLEQVLDARAAARLMPLFEAALAAEPDRRPRSAGQFADDLAGVLGWTGAADVRQTLAGIRGEETNEPGSGQGPERASGDPAVAAGGTAPLGGEPVAAAVGGTVMRKRKRRAPWRGKQADIDWTKRALDLSAPDERARTQADGPEAGDPRPAADGVEDAADAAGSGLDPLDAALDRGGAGGGARHDAGDDLDLRAGIDALADVAEGLDAGLRDGRGGVVPGPGREKSGLDPDSYAPISVGELQSRVEGGRADPAPDAETEGGSEEYDPGDALQETHEADEVVEPEPGEPDPRASDADDAGDIDADGDDRGFALTPEEGYDYGLDDDSEPEDPAGEIFDQGPNDQARRLPVALVAVIGVAVAATAFVIGLGWMGGDDAAPVAGGAAESAAAEDPGRAFSEAVVEEPPPESAAVESSNDAPSPPGGGSPGAAAPPDAAPAEPVAAVREPEPPAAARRPEPVAAREPDPPAPVAPPEAAPAVFDGRLLVRSMPPGAEVIVNGESRGTTPLALAELPYGAYDVEVTLAGYGSRREQITIDEDDRIGAFDPDLTAEPPAGPSAGAAVPADSPPSVEVELGSILAETRPPGVAVWLDQRLVGETPVLIPDVPAGAHQIEFRQEGYRTWTTTVQVASATQARVAASLDEATR